MGKILPVLLALVGLGGGVGAGLALKPAPEVVEINPYGETGTDSPAESDLAAHDGAASSDTTEAVDTEFVKINNQFVVPVIENGKVAALVVMSLSLELDPGNTESFYQREPKLRDLFLQVLFDHANAGGFDGQFTQTGRLGELRLALRESAITALGPIVHDVLISDLVRQDV